MKAHLLSNYPHGPLPDTQDNIRNITYIIVYFFWTHNKAITKENKENHNRHINNCRVVFYLSEPLGLILFTYLFKVESFRRGLTAASSPCQKKEGSRKNNPMTDVTPNKTFYLMLQNATVSSNSLGKVHEGGPVSVSCS